MSKLSPNVWQRMRVQDSEESSGMGVHYHANVKISLHYRAGDEAEALKALDRAAESASSTLLQRQVPPGSAG